jgi:hypothetical protein
VLDHCLQATLSRGNENYRFFGEKHNEEFIRLVWAHRFLDCLLLLVSSLPLSPTLSVPLPQWMGKIGRNRDKQWQSENCARELF